MDCKKRFGEIMRKARESQGMTIEELADQIGMSSVYCRGIEYGRYSTTWITWLKICAVLGIDLSSAAELVMVSVETQ